MDLSKKKIIFLDVDGVIATPQQMASYAKTHGGHCGPGYSQIDLSCVNVLNMIVEKLDALVVISSVWRLRRDDMYDLMTVLGNAGIPVVGMTPHLCSKAGRQMDIAEYCDVHRIPYNHVLVIDDDEADLQNFKPRLLKPSRQYGLQLEDVEKAIAIMS